MSIQPRLALALCFSLVFMFGCATSADRHGNVAADYSGEKKALEDYLSPDISDELEKQFRLYGARAFYARLAVNSSNIPTSGDLCANEHQLLKGFLRFAASAFDIRQNYAYSVNLQVRKIGGVSGVADEPVAEIPVLVLARISNPSNPSDDSGCFVAPLTRPVTPYFRIDSNSEILASFVIREVRTTEINAVKETLYQASEVLGILSHGPVVTRLQQAGNLARSIDKHLSFAVSAPTLQDTVERPINPFHDTEPADMIRLSLGEILGMSKESTIQVGLEYKRTFFGYRDPIEREYVYDTSANALSEIRDAASYDGGKGTSKSLLDVIKAGGLGDSGVSLGLIKAQVAAGEDHPGITGSCQVVRQYFSDTVGLTDDDTLIAHFLLMYHYTKMSQQPLLVQSGLCFSRRDRARLETLDAKNYKFPTPAELEQLGEKVTDMGKAVYDVLNRLEKDERLFQTRLSETFFLAVQDRNVLPLRMYNAIISDVSKSDAPDYFYGSKEEHSEPIKKILSRLFGKTSLCYQASDEFDGHKYIWAMFVLPLCHVDTTGFSGYIAREWDPCLPERRLVPVIPTAVEAEILNPGRPIASDNIMIHRVEIGTIPGIQSRQGIPSYWPYEYDETGKNGPLNCKYIGQPVVSTAVGF